MQVGEVSGHPTTEPFRYAARPVGYSFELGRAAGPGMAGVTDPVGQMAPSCWYQMSLWGSDSDPDTEARPPQRSLGHLRFGFGVGAATVRGPLAATEMAAAEP